MFGATNVGPIKISLARAALRFIANGGEVGSFNKIAGMLGAVFRLLGLGGTAVSVLDEAFTWVPGVDIITMADNVMWLYGAYALYRIFKIRREANHPRVARYG